MAITVSMTTFMDFLVASGTKKITCIEKAKKQYARPYHPSRDFYRALREGIVQMHQQGEPLSALDEVISHLTDPKKMTYYPKCVTGHETCFQGKSIDWIDCRPKSWRKGDLEVKVNPELGLMVDGAPHVVKLYFKAEPLGQAAVEPMLRLIDLSVPRELKGATATVADLQRGRLYTHRGAKRNVDALLAAEAASFAMLWSAVS